MIQPNASSVLVVRSTVDMSVVLPTPAGPVSTTALSDVVSASLMLAASCWCLAVRNTADSCAMPVWNRGFFSPKCASYISAAPIRIERP